MSNLRELPLTGFAPSNADIAKHLREQADWMDEEGAPAIVNVFLVIEYADGQIRRQTCGKPCDLARALGILQMSIIRSTAGV
ncbi:MULTISPECIES: hypothetical protein [Paraburkholderia]|uniref:hypothetical protein n=1 Tax=Paraburkholderia TaxID=1822464 RepID=UPI002251261C|nr:MULTISPECIES: hypothetical protein [Paraburkholderia]MCX4154984.1 hypothetical protein [Paraburkholderia aspalathi]MDN7164394.1 hypothetical protein [Paraburkholderia sp. SECH2]MDQ6392879.1 hypothetical protein [Paraburkholderia aspalathi]